MYPLERCLRHSRWLERADWLWNCVRPFYDALSAQLWRNGLARTINGTDHFVVLPRYGGVPETYEPSVWNHLMSELRPGDVVADIGAFIGLYTIATAKRVGRAGRVFAFEPDRESFAALKAQVELNGVADRVELVPAAVGDRSGAVPFHSGGIESHVTDGPADAAETVACVRLDDVFVGRRVSVVKIDVEGYEGQVLKGAVNLLRDPTRRPRALYIEAHPYAWPTVGTTSDSLLGLLSDCGYRASRLGGQPVTCIDSWGEIIAHRCDDDDDVEATGH